MSSPTRSRDPAVDARFDPSRSDRRRRAVGNSLFWRRIAIAFVASFAAGSCCALVVIWAGGWTHGLPFEIALLDRLHTELPSALDWGMVLLPWLGTNLVFIPVLGPGCWYLWRRRGRPDLAMIIAVVTIGNNLIGTALKLAFERPRPSLWQGRGEYTGASYPSGHAMAIMSVIGLLALLLYEERGSVWPFVVWILLLIATCYSRLYLGVHWPTDVLGGLLTGGVWFAGSLWARRAY